MQAELAQAEADLAEAEAALAQGQVDRATSAQRVATTVADMYAEGDPDLIAFSAMLDAVSTEDLTRRDGVRDVIVGQEARAYDQLKAAEVLLEVTEDQVSEARDEVADQREAAAEHLELMQALETEQQDAKDSVVALVVERRDARVDAREARAKDLGQAAQAPEAAGPHRGDAPQARRPRAGPGPCPGPGAGAVDPRRSVDRPAGLPGRRLRHLALRLPLAPDLPLLGPARRRRLRRRLRYAAARRRAGQGRRVVLERRLRQPAGRRPRRARRQGRRDDLQPRQRLHRRRRRPGRRGRRSSATRATPAGPRAATCTSR